ncbi:MAG: hypothetical protein EBT08_21685 [Betaproteobacteria bacterium]|nr:hypothetical protein [Betaproteobacteria bacterium]
MKIDFDPESTLRSEVTWAWFGTDEEIIDYLDFDWVRLQPQDDEPPWGLSYVDDQETHYACRSRDLICALGGPISVVTLALMYRESMLRIAGEGPISCQDDFDYLERTELDLTSEIPEDLLVRLRALSANVSYYEQFVRICANSKEPDAFVESIRDPELRDTIREIWASGREEWE